MARHFAAGAGGGIDRDDGRQLVGQSFDASIVVVEIAVVGGRNANALAAIMRAAATDGHDEVAFFLAVNSQPIFHIGDPGVGIDVAVHHMGDVGPVQVRLDLIHGSACLAGHELVRDDKRLFPEHCGARPHLGQGSPANEIHCRTQKVSHFVLRGCGCIRWRFCRRRGGDIVFRKPFRCVSPEPDSRTVVLGRHLD